MTIAWLSGGGGASGALSPAERALLDAVAQGRVVVGANLPWPSHPGTFRPGSLTVASVRNGVQFWRARLSKQYRRQVARALDALLTASEPPLLLVTGSQGLELLRLAWPLLTAATSGVRVAALGPVAGPLPAGLDVLVVQSRADRISRLGWRGAVQVVTAGRHLDYVRDPEVADALRRWAATT